MSARSDKQYRIRVGTLKSHLASFDGEPDPQTLSRSYGLPVPDVERIIKETEYARRY